MSALHEAVARALRDQDAKHAPDGVPLDEALYLPLAAVAIGVVLDAVEGGVLYDTALREGIAQGRRVVLAEAQRAVEALQLPTVQPYGGQTMRREALAVLAALEDPPSV